MSEIYSSDSIRASELPQASVTARTRSASLGLGGAAAVAATGCRQLQQVYLGFLKSSLSLLKFTCIVFANTRPGQYDKGSQKQKNRQDHSFSS